jgi:glutamine synthetase
MSIEGINNQYDVVQVARDHDVKFVRLWFTDILGKLKGFAITVNDLEDALEQGVGFDGSAIDGFARHNESDMRAHPDPATFTLLPWRPRQNAVARMFCNIRQPRGQTFVGDPRYVLKRNLDRAAELGYTYNVGSELEFFYLKNASTPELLDFDGYFDQLSSYPASDLRRDTVLNLADMGIPVKYSHHEGAPSQHEIDLEYTDALTMADNLMTAKLVIKELAQLQNVYATFMPKPISGINGSGLHLHQSLFQGDSNVFYDPDDEQYLSVIGKHFIAGLIAHAPEITLVTNQWVNSYKRLIPGYEAPVYVSWTHVNRSDLIRVPSYERGAEASIRIEYRASDPACNPYLAFSAMLAAGLKGIEEQYQVPPPVVGNVLEMSPQRRHSLGIKTLPTSLGEAINLAETSDLLYEALGDHVFASLIENKKMEWEDYRSMVTDYEVSRYLSTL